jgi:hypothetical protein
MIVLALVVVLGAVGLLGYNYFKPATAAPLTQAEIQETQAAEKPGDPPAPKTVNEDANQRAD